MNLNPGKNDLLVYLKGDNQYYTDDEIKMHYFQGNITLERQVIDDKNSILFIHFENGGRLEIFSDRPFIWIEPDRM